MMTLIFGEEKSAKPRPRVANIIMIREIEVVAVMVAAMPTGKTPFDDAVVASKTVTDESAAAITELREATGRA